jgi:MerR family transcriptional regulator, heat shock protein HspR
VHEPCERPCLLPRWEENGLIAPERATMGKTTLRIYDEETVRVLRRAKAWMDTGMGVSDAFGRARAESEHDEIEREGQQSD